MTLVDLFDALLAGTLDDQAIGAANQAYVAAEPVLRTAAFWYQILALIVIVFALYVLVYSAMMYNEVRAREREAYRPVKIKEQEANARRVQWEVILGHVNSANHAEWKLAVLEADKMLEDILDERGYVGAGLGEKLKDANGKFKTVQLAWEGHKLRNRIAHEQQLEMTNKMARDAAAQFQAVFEELGVI